MALHLYHPWQKARRKHGIEWHTIKCYNGIVKNWAQMVRGSFLRLKRYAGIGDAGAGGWVGLYTRGAQVCEPETVLQEHGMAPSA